MSGRPVCYYSFKSFHGYPEVFERQQIEIDESNYFTITEVVNRRPMWSSETLSRLRPIYVCSDHSSSWQSNKACRVSSSLNCPSPGCWCFIEVLWATSGACWSGERYCLSLPCSLDELLITSQTEVGRPVQENGSVVSRMWPRVSIHGPK